MQASIPELAEQGYSGPVVVTEQGQDTPEGLILGAQVRPAAFAAAWLDHRGMHLPLVMSGLWSLAFRDLGRNSSSGVQF